MQLWRRDEGMTNGMQAAQRAMELDPRLADAYVARGCARMAFDWNWDGAEKDLRQAMKLSPHSLVVMDGYANFMVYRGRFEEAAAIVNRELEFDPFSPGLHASLGYTYWMWGQVERAIDQYRKVLELDPNFHVSRSHLGWCYLMSGKTEAALAELEKLVHLAPDYQWAHAYLGSAYGVAGRRPQALQALADLDQLESKRYVNPCAKACVQLGLGQTNAALELLERAYRERDSWIIVILVEPPFAPLRDEPRFRALLKNLGHVK
jgi:tetratricopeptide (TPR) repeat protein